MIIFRRFRLLGCFNYMCKTFKAFYEMVACIIVTEIQTSFLFILRGSACFKIWIVMWKIQEMVPKSWEKWNCYANYTNHCNFIFISNVCRLLFDFFFCVSQTEDLRNPETSTRLALFIVMTQGLHLFASFRELFVLSPCLSWRVLCADLFFFRLRPGHRRTWSHCRAH